MGWREMPWLEHTRVDSFWRCICQYPWKFKMPVPLGPAHGNRPGGGNRQVCRDGYMAVSEGIITPGRTLETSPMPFRRRLVRNVRAYFLQWLCRPQRSIRGWCGAPNTEKKQGAEEGVCQEPVHVRDLPGITWHDVQQRVQRELHPDSKMTEVTETFVFIASALKKKSK